MSLTPGRTAAYDAAPANASKRPDAIKHLRLQFTRQIVRWNPELPGESATRPGDAVFEDKEMKRIIVCCDGTWNADDLQTNDTNVAVLARAIHGSQQTGGTLQIVLYVRGVGTTGLKLETWIEGATGFVVDDNIRSAYQFIAQNYVPGDEIYLFGFSRGAFTARSLAGLITACGILFRPSLGALPDAWIYYRSPRPHSPAAFATKYGVQSHLDPSITFLGVWDTVGSLGIPGSLLAASNKEKFAFHDTNPSPLVKRARRQCRGFSQRGVKV